MERMENKDLIKAADRKSVAQARDTLSKIGKGDDKIDTSKMKIRQSDRDKNLAAAVRFRMGLPKTMSDDAVLQMYRKEGLKIQQKNISDKAKQKDKAFGNPNLSDQDAKMLSGQKAGGAKIPKKSIMELPTNVPRLMKGANLMNPDKADLNKDGKLSGYEKARGKAIEKNIKKAKTGISFLDNLQKDTQARKRLSSAERREFEDIANLVSPQQKKNLGKNLRKIQSLGGDAQVNKTIRKFIKGTGGAKVQKIAKKAGNPELQRKQGFIGAAGKK